MARSLLTYVLLDARPVNEYDGTVNSEVFPEAGHIAGARQLVLEESDPLGSDAGAAGSVASCNTHFSVLAPSRGQRVVTYCRTGMQSSFTYFVAKYLGYDAAMYDGSVYEWVNAAGNQLVLRRIESGA